LLFFTYAYSQCCHGPDIERKIGGRRDRRKGRKKKKGREREKEKERQRERKG